MEKPTICSFSVMLMSFLERLSTARVNMTMMMFSIECVRIEDREMTSGKEALLCDQ